MASGLDEKKPGLKEGSGNDEENRPSLPSQRVPSPERGVRFIGPLRRDSLDLAFKAEDGYPPADDVSSDDEENRPPLPVRPAPSVDRDLRLQYTSISSMKYDRSQETVMAYMIPLPRPVIDGVPQDQVPQRYMLYMPPSPDLLKIPKDKGKERKRDKAVRLWQEEVKKAKTYNGSLVSLRGMECASVRGAVWALNFIKPADVTFLSRIPRKSIRSLNLIHPEWQEEAGARDDSGGDLTRSRAKESPEEMYDGVKEELSRSKKRTRRDFFIGTALLPVTTAIDLAIPVFGGLSEVNLVWMVLNATGWVVANKITGRLVLADPNSTPQQRGEDDIYAAGAGDHPEKGAGDETAPAREGTKKTKKMRKRDEQKIEMAFSPCPAMGAMAQYVQAACHKCDPTSFPAPEYSPGEAEVLTRIGWAPERQGREAISEEDDVAVSPTTQGSLSSCNLVDCYCT